MPLNTQVLRNDKPLPLRWGSWHLSCMLTAALYEQSPEWIDSILMGDLTCEAERKFTHDDQEFDKIIKDLGSWFSYYVDWPADLIKRGAQTLKGEWRFYDPQDGEILHLLPGDQLVMYRGS